MSRQPKKSPVTAARRRKLLLSYAPDWIITIVLAAIFFSLDRVHGFKRQFSLEDTSLRHTYAVHERIPPIALYMIAIVAPVILQALINVVTIRSWWDLHNGASPVPPSPSILLNATILGLLGLALSLSLTGSVTQFTKLTVGRPRPDILDRCQPIPGSVDPIYGLSNSSICTTSSDAYIMKDGFRSFPSGHSSLSFAGLGFLAFFLAGKLHLFDNRGYVAKAWVSLLPFAGAALVAISRTMDNRHHWQDVLVGSALGTVVSYFSYRQYYPSLASEVSHRPYSPRVAREDIPILAHHIRSSSQQAYVDHHATADDVVSTGPLEGTVLRDGPRSLREVWRNSADHNETSALGKHPARDSISLDSV